MILQAIDNESLAQDDKSSDYISVTLCKTKLLTTRSDIHLIKPVDDRIQIKQSVMSTGRMELDGRIIPVYCFSEDFEIEKTVSMENPVCIVLKQNNNYVGILCTEVTSFNQQIIKIQAIPDCMKSYVRPITGLCLTRSKAVTEVNYLLSIQALLEYIDEYNAGRA